MPRSKRLLLVAVPALLLVALIVVVLLRADRVLRRANESSASADRVAFSLLPVDLRAVSDGFQSIAAKESFTCGAFLRGEIVLGGPGGLAIYASDGRLRRTLHTGLELPVAPISAMATGRLRGATEDQVFIATAGGGLLLLSSDGRGGIAMQNLLAASDWARDLTALLPMPSGDLILGTRHGGVLLYAGSLQTLRFTVNGLEATRLEVTALAASDASAVLIGTRTAGIVALRGGVAQRLTLASGMPDDAIESLVSEGGRSFAGTPSGVAELRAGPEMQVSRVLARGIFSNALAFDESAGMLSVGTLDQGILDVPLEASKQVRPRIHQRCVRRAEPVDSAGKRAAIYLRTAATVRYRRWNAARPRWRRVEERTAAGRGRTKAHRQHDFGACIRSGGPSLCRLLRSRAGRRGPHRKGTGAAL